MINWIYQSFLLDKIKKGLDKLPFSGWKTVIGILLWILGAALKTSPIIGGLDVYFLANLLAKLPHDIITDASIVAVITGLVHKVLKWIEGYLAKKK